MISASICRMVSWSVPALGAGLDVGQPFRRRCDAVDVIFDAHDDNAGFAAAVHDEALIVLGRPLEDLPQLGAGGKGGNDIVRGFGGWLNDEPLTN